MNYLLHDKAFPHFGQASKMLVTGWQGAVISAVSMLALLLLLVCSMAPPCSGQFFPPFGSVGAPYLGHACLAVADPLTCTASGCIFGTDSMGCDVCTCPVGVPMPMPVGMPIF
ncbi:uncharacterized protein LOC111252853 [Varroa destructor]|uniref:Uncharacterized protein n=1 Tax=Varroa destructor TaxID=109461 RepID=A0A7M7KHU6_VARDE|nr:uncharacterized protein LOC111252853 [Varroa destructor]